MYPGFSIMRQKSVSAVDRVSVARWRASFMLSEGASATRESRGSGTMTSAACSMVPSAVIAALIAGYVALNVLHNRRRRKHKMKKMNRFRL